MKLDHPVVEKEMFHREFTNTYGDKPKKPKIIIKGLNLFDGCLDECGSIIPGKTTLIVTAASSNLLKALVCIVNSPLPLFYFREKYPAFSYNKGTTFTKVMINNFPVPDLSDEIQKTFASLYAEIVRAIKNEDDLETSRIQREINSVVSKLYMLTEDEYSLITAK